MMMMMMMVMMMMMMMTTGLTRVALKLPTFFKMLRYNVLSIPVSNSYDRYVNWLYRV